MVIGRITKGGQPVKKAKWLGTDFALILSLNTEAKIVMDPTKSLKIAHPGTPVSYSNFETTFRVIQNCAEFEGPSSVTLGHNWAYEKMSLQLKR